MTLARRFAEQLARPTGRSGRLLGLAMDLANRKPTRIAIDRLRPVPGESILDAGCGTGAAMRALLRLRPGALTGIDPSATMIAAARRRLGDSATLHVSTLEALPLPDACFDAALALNMLYFCDRESGMIRAFHRLLKPGGRLVAYVTHRRSMEDWAFARQGIHRLFDADELADAIAEGGFARDHIHVEEISLTASIRGLVAHAER